VIEFAMTFEIWMGQIGFRGHGAFLRIGVALMHTIRVLVRLLAQPPYLYFCGYSVGNYNGIQNQRVAAEQRHNLRRSEGADGSGDISLERILGLALKAQCL
jgi:hypothetical protein